MRSLCELPAQSCGGFFRLQHPLLPHTRSPAGLTSQALAGRSGEDAGLQFEYELLSQTCSKQTVINAAVGTNAARTQVVLESLSTSYLTQNAALCVVFMSL